MSPAKCDGSCLGVRHICPRAGVIQYNGDNALAAPCCIQMPLWRKPTHTTWAMLSSGEWPFHLILPIKFTAHGHSACRFQEYHVFWCVEASVSPPHTLAHLLCMPTHLYTMLNHIPIAGVCHDLFPMLSPTHWSIPWLHWSSSLTPLGLTDSIGSDHT